MPVAFPADVALSKLVGVRHYHRSRCELRSILAAATRDDPALEQAMAHEHFRLRETSSGMNRDGRSLLSRLLGVFRRRRPTNAPGPVAAAAPVMLPDLGMPGEPFELSVPPPIEALCAKFGSHGHWLVVVGGSVRDLLIGRTPSSSWDLATSATVYQVARICRGAVFEDTSHTEFTLAFATHEGFKLEITPFRDRHDYQWSRGPDPRPEQPVGTLAEDLRGRDFTINAIAYDPLDRILFDPFDGCGDLRHRLLRALPDPETRFRFDPVRILRGIRISVKLDFEIVPETRAAMGSSLEDARHDARLTLMELVRLLCGPHPSRSLALLHGMGHLAWVCPALAEVAEERDPWDPGETLFDRLAQVLDQLSPATPFEAMGALAAACMVRDVPKAPWETFAARQSEALGRAFDEQLRRLLAPMEVPEGDDDSIWWIAAFGSSEGLFTQMIASAQAWESAWDPTRIAGWPRLAEAWWGARAVEDGARAPATGDPSRDG